MTGNIDTLIAAATFDEHGLMPVIAQDAQSGVVRMQAWANEEALRATFASGFATFYSRSRGELWCKGATSGNVMRTHLVRLDCDGDSALYLVDADGPSCHTGKTSCFFRTALGETLSEDDGPPEPSAVILHRVAAAITERRTKPASKSYVSSLLHGGWPKILGKITEEAGELVEALPAADKAHTAHEAADLIFHLMVGLEQAGVPIDDLFAELRSRFGTSGHVEKASRSRRKQ